MKYVVCQYGVAKGTLLRQRPGDRRRVVQAFSSSARHREQQPPVDEEHTVDDMWVVVDNNRLVAACTWTPQDRPCLTIEYVVARLDLPAMLMAADRSSFSVNPMYILGTWSGLIEVRLGGRVRSHQVVGITTARPIASLAIYRCPGPTEVAIMSGTTAVAIALRVHAGATSPPPPRHWNRYDALIVTAQVTRSSPTRQATPGPDPGATSIRTLMEVWEGRGGAQEVRFTPPVGAWNTGPDAELHVWWKQRPCSRWVDLLSDDDCELEASTLDYPKLCNMHLHAPAQWGLLGSTEGSPVLAHLEARGPLIVKRAVPRHSLYPLSSETSSSETYDEFEALGAFRILRPAGQGDVKDQNFLTAGYHLGFDTQGSTPILPSSSSVKNEKARLYLLARAGEKVRQRHAPAARIQAAWREAVSNPEYAACRRRLLWEFSEYTKSL